MRGNCKIMKLQSVQEKITRYNEILRYFGPKLTFAYYFTQQSDSKYYDFSKKVLLDFVLKLRKEAQIDELRDENREVFTKFPKIIWTMWQQGESQMPETVKASVKTIKDFAERNSCEFHLLTDKNLESFVNIPKDITEKYKKKELSAAHYSDIVRTNKMERTICDYKWSGFFLAGQKGGPHFKHIRDLYIYYVRKYPIFIHYLMMDYFILSEYNSNPGFRTLVDKLPVLETAERMWFLREHADKLFDENEWAEVLEMTPIMKTTYKINKDTLIPGSYLYKLFHGELYK